MTTTNTVYENKFCKIVDKGTIYILKSKSGKYNDQYFQTKDAALRAIGVDPNPIDWSKYFKNIF